MPSPRSFTSFPSQADLFYFCTTSSTSEEDLNIHYAPPSKSSLLIGVIVLGQEPLQLLDLAALDLLAMIGRNRLSRTNTSATAISQAVDEIDIRYVSVTGEGSFPVTAGTRMPVTNSFTNAPQFDILFLPSSISLVSPTPLSPPASTFLTTQCLNPSLLAIITIGPGISHLAQTGILHGTRATAPKAMLPGLQHRYPDTLWQYEAWARHGKVWSCGSPVAALEMVRVWMREYFWDRGAAVEGVVGCVGLDEEGSVYDYGHCDY